MLARVEANDTHSTRGPLSAALCVGSVLALIATGCAPAGPREQPEDDPAYVETREAAKTLLGEIEDDLEALPGADAATLADVGQRLDAYESRLAEFATDGEHPIAIDRARDRLEVLTQLHVKSTLAQTSAAGIVEELAAARFAVSAEAWDKANRAFNRAEKHALALKGTRIDQAVRLDGRDLTVDEALVAVRRERAAITDRLGSPE